MGSIPFIPEQASAGAGNIDLLFFALVGVTLFFIVGIFGLIVFFAVRYRHENKVDRVIRRTDYIKLELTWIIIPTLLSIGIFVWSAWLYFEGKTPPSDAMEIYVTGKQWMWKIQHPKGNREINELHVPVGVPVKLIMTSQDVIHSFFVPAFRIKADVLPGRFTTTWFRPTKVGTYHLFCAEYCGTEHSGMIGEVVVMEPPAYQAWLAAGGAAPTMAANGKELFSQLGCATCHRTDTQGRGPNLVGMFGRPVQLADGRSVIADENYIRESILNPQAKVTAGFQPIMPTFQGQVTEESLGALVSYLKSLSQPQQKAEVGAPQQASAGESN